MVISLMSGCGKKEPYVYAGVELLENGNMEEDPKTSFPSGWGKGGTPEEGQLNHITYITDSEDDNSYIKIDTITKENNFIYAYQSIENNIPKGKKLKLTVKIKTENLTGGGAAIAIRCNVKGKAAQFVSTQWKIPIEGTKDWTTYTVELNERVRSDIESITAFLLFTSDTSGTVYFDDASLIY